MSLEIVSREIIELMFQEVVSPKKLFGLCCGIHGKGIFDL